MSLQASIKKVRNSERLSTEETYELYMQAERTLLGMLADSVRRRKHARGAREGIVTYIIDRNINPTNVCVVDCGFCAFYRRPGDSEGYVHDHVAIFAKIDELLAQGGIQILIQGGHHPYLKTQWFAELFQAISERYPELWIHGMSPPEIHHLAQLDKISVHEVIGRLKDAGLDSIPGGGAEILVDRVRDIISPKKVNSEGWLDVMRQAAVHGLRGSATMMFGHVETQLERIEHLEKLRALQDETDGFFTSFIPWTFQAQNTPMEEDWQKSHRQATWSEYLRMLAISRIHLDNFENVQSSWVTQGLKTCQMGLAMGANDVGSMMLEENVVSSAGCTNMTTVTEIERHIKDAGFVPRRRNMQFDLLDERTLETAR